MVLGIDWQANFETPYKPYQAVRGNDKWVMTAAHSDGRIFLLWSVDGNSWTPIDISSYTNFAGRLVFVPGVNRYCMIVGDKAIVINSALTTFTEAAIPNIINWLEYDIAVGYGIIVLVGSAQDQTIGEFNRDAVKRSTDGGLTWSLVETPNPFSTVEFLNDIFLAGTSGVAVFDGGTTTIERLYYSTDGTVWNVVQNNTNPYRIIGSAFNGSTYVILASIFNEENDSVSYVSMATGDLFTGSVFSWLVINMPPGNWYNVYYLNGKFYATGGDNSGGGDNLIAVSNNGSSWTVVYSLISGQINHLAFGNGAFIGTGYNYDYKEITVSSGLTRLPDDVEDPDPPVDPEPGDDNVHIIGATVVNVWVNDDGVWKIAHPVVIA